MKKLFITLALTALSFIATYAADMSEVWTEIKQFPGLFVDEVAPEKAKANGFQNLLTAINSAPTSADIKNIKSILAKIDSNQKITTVSQQGIDVSVYVAPAAADASLFKVMLGVTKDDNEDKMLVVLYGICTQEGMIDALQNMSLIDIIGG